MKKALMIITMFISIFMITNVYAKVDLENTHIVVNGTELKANKNQDHYTFKVGLGSDRLTHINALDDYDYEGLGPYEIYETKDIKLIIKDPKDGDKKEVIITLIPVESSEKKKINLISQIATFFIFFFYIILIYIISRFVILGVIKILDLTKK